MESFILNLVETIFGIFFLGLALVMYHLYIIAEDEFAKNIDKHIKNKTFNKICKTITTGILVVSLIVLFFVFFIALYQICNIDISSIQNF